MAFENDGRCSPRRYSERVECGWHNCAGNSVYDVTVGNHSLDGEEAPNRCRQSSGLIAKSWC